MIYLERQNKYGPYKLRQVFDLGVKDEGQTKVTIVRDTPSNGHEPTYPIILTYLERQKRLWPGQASPIILPLLVSKVKVKRCHDGTQQTVL